MTELSDVDIVTAIKDSEKHVLAEFNLVIQRVKCNEDKIESLKELVDRIDKYHCGKEVELAESIKEMITTNRWYKDIYIRIAAIIISIAAILIPIIMFTNKG